MKSKLSFAVILLLSGAVGACANASPCTTEAIGSISNDRSLTSLQRQQQIDDLCIGQRLSVIGEVTDVTRSTISLFPLRGDLTTSYSSGHSFNLANDHQCGDLLALRIGDVLHLEGTIDRVWGAIQALRFSDSVCLLDR